jgi:excinuclease ABC subunit C
VRSLYCPPSFSGFGPSALERHSSMPVQEITAKGTRGLRSLVRERCPARPGVYGMVNATGELIYVGKAKYLRSRLLGYFRPHSRDPKAGRIVRLARMIVWEHAPSEFAALLRELELIRRWRPALNVQGQPGRRLPIYVCLGGEPAPHVFLAGRPPKSTRACFGPIGNGPRPQEAVRRLNDYFGLRDCPQPQHIVFAGERELFPVDRTAGCLRYEIGTCLGPCLGACSRSAYFARVRAARAFLDGSDLSCLQALDRAMAESAAALAFEQAAAWRDKLQTLRWLHERLQWIRQERMSGLLVYPVAGYRGDDRWYLLADGIVRAALPVPRDAATRQMTARSLEAFLAHRRAGPASPGTEEMDRLFLLASWFRKHPAERARLRSVEERLRETRKKLPPAI